jgi:hypothetical protein
MSVLVGGRGQRHPFGIFQIQFCGKDQYIDGELYPQFGRTGLLKSDYRVTVSKERESR